MLFRSKYLYGVFTLRDGEAVELCHKPTAREANRERDNYYKYHWSNVTDKDELVVIRYERED